jgi:hypothetical protein
MRRMVRTWRYLGWKHPVVALAAGALISLSIVLATLHLGLESKHFWYASGFWWYSAFAAVFIVAVAFVEANAPRRRPGLRSYAAAACFSALICLGGAYSVAEAVMDSGYRRTTPGGSAPKVFTADQRRPTAVFARGFDGVMHCVIGMFVYVRLRNARLTALALQRRQEKASESSRAEADARLESVSRRVDPRSLTQTLDDIERTYWVDPERAEARLDELTEFLRAAIPQTRARRLTQTASAALDSAE